MSIPGDIPSSEIAAFCKRWQITELALFGSILRDDYHADSDVDILVSFHPNVRYTLFDMVRMREELQQILGRPVDLVSRRAVNASRNFIRKKSILESAEVLYAT